MSTGWPAVRDTCAQLGITFDPWQDGLGRAITAKSADGFYATDTVAISIPRQAGKTYLIGWLVFALCIIQPGLTVLWTAHRTPTADETFEKMKAMAYRPRMRPHIEKAVKPEGNGRVVFRNASRVLFGARENGFGRGFDAVDIEVFDEAQILTENATDDMIPAMQTVENALALYIGTPPKEKDRSEVFSRLRREAIKERSGEVLYVEFSADRDADPNDREQWRKANPSFPARTSERAMLRTKKNLTDASWLREGLGVWDELGESVLPRWGERVVDEAMPPKLTVGLGGSVDGKWGSIGAAGRLEDGRVMVGAVDRRQGQAWLVEEAARIQSEHGFDVAVDGKGPLSHLLPELDAAGVRFEALSTTEYLDACAAFWRLVDDGDLVHPDHVDLNRAVAVAQWRKVGDRRAFARQTGEISMLETVTVATWALTNAPAPADPGVYVL